MKFAIVLWGLSFSSAHSADLLRGPYIQSCTQTSAVIRWRTDAEIEGMVRFGTNEVLNQTAADSSPTTEHQVLLTGLAAGQRYYYSIGDSENTLASGVSYFFITAPAQPKPTRIWAIGDSGTGNGTAAVAVRDAYMAFTGSRYTDVWLMLGDNAYGSGTDPQYQSAVFDFYPELLRQTCLWPTIGNHDYSYGPRGYVYTDIFTLPPNGEAGGVSSGNEFYYSYNYSDVHFIVLDSEYNSRAPGSPMLTWLEQDLAANVCPWTIVYFHHPPYTKGTHDSDEEYQLIEMRQNVLPILEANNVDLVLAGHSHVYERSFLLNGHYGHSTTFNSGMKVDGGSGRTNETGAYGKGLGGNQGIVYAVVGCSGQVGGGYLDHPAMFVSYGGVGGSLVVDVDGERLDGKFLSESGIILDSFTIIKSFPGPSLSIVRTGTETAISWAVTADTYTLETTGDLNPPVSWSLVTNVVQQQSDRHVVLLPSPDAHKYFRLRK